MFLLAGCGEASQPPVDIDATVEARPEQALPAVPTPTATATQVPPTATPTSVPPTATSTPVPATPTPTPIPQWQSIGPTIDEELQYVKRFVVSQQNDGSVVYVGTGDPGRILKWSESAQDWTDVSFHLPAFGWVSALAVDPRNPRVIYAGLGGGKIDGQMAKSADSGETWTLHQQDGGESFAISNEDPRVIYSGTRHGLLKSVDGGESWQLLDNGIATRDFIVWSVAIDPQDNSIVLAGGEDQTLTDDHKPRLFPSKDAGNSWAELTFRAPTGADYLPAPKKADCPDHNPANPSRQPVPRGRYGTLIWHFVVIVFDPENSQTIYIGTEGYGLIRSKDVGQHWTKPDAGFFARTGGKVWGLTFDPGDSTRLFASVWAMGTLVANVFEGSDEGQLWKQVGEFLLPGIIGDLAISEDGTLLYASVNWGLLPDLQPAGLWRLERVPTKMDSNQ